ncbi:hypothetical protein ANANG_G00314590 [Anguilla anguilla]|uniref:C-type lectin domain-containing protein n=1 Tax=Anguilla anguilla TaxID=7936 RepID=A0A9D3RHJ9_ANGAN|nr:hypothetical protein ANANG_G00314590 [Anguilla anguilla]
METSPLLIVLTAALCTSAFPSHYRRTFSATNERMTWTAAQAYCRENHADLATVYSQEEAERIVNTTTDDPFVDWSEAQ